MRCKASAARESLTQTGAAPELRVQRPCDNLQQFARMFQTTWQPSSLYLQDIYDLSAVHLFLVRELTRVASKRAGPKGSASFVEERTNEAFCQLRVSP